ncbi:MAG: spore germination protein GerW family protein [Bacillota bacterium]|nr:spore germination protein GerW family protein [Bacillota bacterium]
MFSSEKTNADIAVLFEKLENFVKTKTVVGETIQIGDTTLIPFVTVSFGLGSGGGDGTDNKGSKGVGGGAGIGARVVPTAVLVIQGDKIEMISISKPGNLSKLLEMVPELITKFKPEAGCCSEEK